MASDDAITKIMKTILFPFRVLLDLIAAIFTEVEICMMALTSIVLGILLGWLWGIAIFLGSWTVFHMLGGYASLLARGLRGSKS